MAVLANLEVAITALSFGTVFFRHASLAISRTHLVVLAGFRAAHVGGSRGDTAHLAPAALIIDACAPNRDETTSFVTYAPCRLWIAAHGEVLGHYPAGPVVPTPARIAVAGLTLSTGLVFELTKVTE